MDGFDIFNVYWPGGGLRVIPEVLSSAMHKVRRRVADSPVGQKMAQELGVKPKEIAPSGESVPIYGSSGSITWLLGGTNPSASWITDALFEKSWGRHQRGKTRYYISSGLGIWGPKIRIGSRSEYVVLRIIPHET